MLLLIETLKAFYAAVRNVYVSGNLLIFYEAGNKRKHVAPDVFVVLGVAKHDRPNYLVWEETKGPDLVIELTSSSTRGTDQKRKLQLYRDVLKVKENFLFDPLGDYLNPPLQGHRLHRGQYLPIRPIKGRLPSRVLGLHLEAHGRELRLFDPVTGQRVPTPPERLVQAESAWQQEAAARQLAEAARQQAEAAQQRAEAELERLRREIADLRCRPTEEA